MATLASEKLRSRKRPSGISGSGTRVCQATNSPSTTTPPMISPHAAGPHAKVWPSWMPNTSRNIPTALSATPTRSNRRTTVDSAGTSRTARTNPTTPTGTLTMKIHCQPRLSTSRPPTIGPTRTATPATAPHRLIARPRWCAGNVRVITAIVCGDRIDAPNPCTTRATIRPPIEPVSPHHREAAVKTARPIRYMRLGPNRSPSLPVISSGTA